MNDNSNRLTQCLGCPLNTKNKRRCTFYIHTQYTKRIQVDSNKVLRVDIESITSPYSQTNQQQQQKINPTISNPKIIRPKLKLSYNLIYDAIPNPNTALSIWQILTQNNSSQNISIILTLQQEQIQNTLIQSAIWTIPNTSIQFQQTVKT